MSWLDDQIEEKRNFDERRAKIDADAVTLSDDLWVALCKIAAEAGQKGFTLNPNVTETKRSIGFGAVNMLGHRRMDFALTRDKPNVTASWGGDSIRFEIDICNDGTVCLNWKGVPVSIDRAAHQIMRSFLFPELPKRASDST